MATSPTVTAVSAAPKQSPQVSAANAIPVWNNPELCNVNRLRGRVPFQSFANSADALAGAKPQERSLNGQWKFDLVSNPQKTPANFMQPSYKDAKWDDIAVPGCFTMQGYGKPHYTNVIMPFSELPPFTPEDNPTGLYRKTFQAPAAWLKKRIVLRFGSIESMGQIWLNGQAVGISKDSRLACEFDITEYLQAGENLLAVQAIKFSDASFVEDQDQWWQAGIARDVDILILPKVAMEDVSIYADYDPQSGAGHIDFSCRIFGIESVGWTVSTQAIDAKGKKLGKAHSTEIYYTSTNRPHGRALVSGMGSSQQDFAKVQSWNHEDPYLYSVLISLKNPQGKEVEATVLRTGFRRIEVKDRELLINGKAVLIKGVNRHEHDENKGKVISRELMLKDMQVLKQHNVNAVRTSHYPPDPYFFDLCDQYGLYCMDEANIETHHYYNEPCNDPRYLAAFVDRGSRMVLRDRNHCSIFSWSLGNESGYGPNHDAMAAWIRHIDPTRIMHYEGSGNVLGWEHGHASSDLVCPMYPGVADIVKWAKETSDWRPFIMCEFSHAMGNACGSLKEYWEAIETHHGLQGGFSW
ncbi:MAG: beta-galactosidase, partial [Planctomycetes bacterium]|nr:beta-galactosidase [Planctomycetota bacterium]